MARPCSITSQWVCSPSAQTLEQVQRQICSMQCHSSLGGGQQFSKSQVAINHANESGQELGLMETQLRNFSSTTHFLREELAKSKTERLKSYLLSQHSLSKRLMKSQVYERSGRIRGQWSDLRDTDSSQSLQTGCGNTLGELPAFICSVFFSMKED